MCPIVDGNKGMGIF